MGAVAVAFVDDDDRCGDDAVEKATLTSTSTSCQGSKSKRGAETLSTRAVWGDDLVVVHGGLGEGRFALDDTWILESSSVSSSCASAASSAGEEGGWVCLPAENSPPPRAFHCGAALGASLFIFGGHALEQEEEKEDSRRGGNKQRLRKRNDLFELRLDRLEWRQLSPPPSSSSLSSPLLPCPRDFASMCSLPKAGSRGGLLLLHGGLDQSDRRLGDTWLYDVGPGRWKKVETGLSVASSLSPSSSPSPSPSTAASISSSSSSSSSLYPLPRYGASLTRIGGRAFLVGGDTGALGGGKVELFSFVAGAASAAVRRGDDNDDGSDDEDAPPAWIRLELPGAAPEARRGHAAAALGNWLVLAGGRRVQTATAAAAAAANSGGGGLWRGGGLLQRRRGSAGGPASSPSKEGDGNDDGGLFADAFVLVCGGSQGLRWRRASGGLGLGGEEEEEEEDEENSEDNDSRALRREFASLLSLPAVDGGCLLLLGGGDGKGRLLADAQRATLAPAAAGEGGPFAGRAPPPPPPPLAPLALRGFGGRIRGSSRWKQRTPEGQDGGSGPGTPLSAASGSDDGGEGAFSSRPRPLPRLWPLPATSLSLPPPLAAEPATEAKMEALRTRLDCCRSRDGGGDGGSAAAPALPPSSSAPSSASASSSSRLGDRARSSSELAGLCTKETSELTMGDLRLLLAVVKQAGERDSRRRGGRGQQQRNGDGGDGDGDDGEDEKEIDLFCSVEPPETLRLGRAKVLQQAAAAALRLL